MPATTHHYSNEEITIYGSPHCVNILVSASKGLPRCLIREESLD